MTYAITIFILLIFLYFVYKKENDLLSPVSIYTLSMIICVLCSFIGTTSWNDVRTIKFKTIVIIIISVFSFSLGKLLLNRLLKKKDISLNSIKKNKKLKRFNVDKFLIINNNQKYDLDLKYIILQILFITITFILLYNEVKRIALIAGYDGIGFGNMVNKFRDLSILYTTEFVKNGQNINIVVSQMRKICEVFCFFNIFLLTKKIIDKDVKNYKTLLYLFIIFLCILLSLLTGGRMQIFIYIIAFIFLFIFLKFKGDYSINIIKKYFKQLILIFVALICGFYILLPLSGRSTNSDLISYISFYFGASVPSLDKYLSVEHEEPKYFGEETLRGIQTVLYKFKITDEIQPISKEWINYTDKKGNTLSSNIFTSAKRYYHDFGFVGIVICQILFGFTFEFIYYLAKKSNYILVFFSMYYYMCIDQIRDELFFANFVHINAVFKFLVLFVLFIFLKTVKKRKLKYEK